MEQESNITNTSDHRNESQKLWDNYSLSYYSSMNKNSIGLMCTLIALTRVHTKYAILDAGCGPGLGTKQIALDIPNYNSIIYAFDFSEQMIKLAEQVFCEYEDFNSNLHNHWEVMKMDKIYNSNENNISNTTPSLINIERDNQNLRNKKIGKIVKFFQGNIEKLPFEDEQFDVYLSNLCLMLADDVDSALREAFRVTKKGGAAAFSIWGDKKNTKYAFKIFHQFYEKYGIETTNERSSYWLAQDSNELKEKINKAGFRDVRMEYTNEIFDCYDEVDYLVKFQGPGVNAILKKINDDKLVSDLLVDVKNEAKKHLVEDKNLPTLNCLVIIAFK